MEGHSPETVPFNLPPVLDALEGAGPPQPAATTAVADAAAGPAIATSSEVSGDESFEYQLAVARLGIAGSLFTALDCKHSPTAAHSLRVALACSHWALALQLDETEIDQIELAALLHDVGKVAFPDAILLKPGHLGPAEMALMDGYRQAGLRILGSCCASSEILDIVRWLPAWYDGSRVNYPLAGRQIPFGADAGDRRRLRFDDH